MRRLIRWIIILGIVGGGMAAGFGPAMSYWKERNRVRYRDAEMTYGNITAVVNSTGTVKPVQSVSVGAAVSGPITKVLADFNDEVKKDQLLAEIDPQLYKAALARDKAALATRRAEVDQVRAKLQQAKNDEARAMALRTENKGYISDTEVDNFRFNRASLEAQLAVAQTSIDQALANLEQSEANLGYTAIKSPVDGMVIDRKIDPGQTVAASFQTPELFTVAPDMRNEMRVYASVDEADIGLIRDAQISGQPVRFTVDAYPDDLFPGTIFQIRKNSTTTQNVVTYPVIVSAPNKELKLLPGMTASISFQVGEKKDVVRIPNAALRFYPQREQVRPEDRKILESAVPQRTADDEQMEAVRSAEDKASMRRERNRRYVWVLDGELLKGVPVITGLSDNKNTELVSGELKVGDKLVTGVVPKGQQQ